MAPKDEPEVIDSIVSTDNDAYNDNQTQHWQPCHSLPCNIDYSGRAQVEVYFSPQLIPTSEATSNNDPMVPTIQEDRVYSAQFRGRQLLAAEPYQHTSSVHDVANPNPVQQQQGRLLEIDATKGQSSKGVVRVKAKFSNIHEWKHEYDPDVVRRNNVIGHQSRVRAALEWCDVAHAVSTEHVRNLVTRLLMISVITFSSKTRSSIDLILFLA